MDKVFDMIIGYGEEKLDQLQTELSKIQDNLSKLKEKPPFDTTHLALLNPSIHTLGMIHILYAIFLIILLLDVNLLFRQIVSSNPKLEKDVFINFTTQLIVHGAPKQIQMEPKRCTKETSKIFFFLHSLFFSSSHLF